MSRKRIRSQKPLGSGMSATPKSRAARRPASTLLQRHRVVAALALVTMLIAATAILAHLTPKQDLGGFQKSKAEQLATPVPGNLTPANLSKEYVYGPGGRLVATEEPNAIAPTLMSFAASGGTGT